MGTNVCTTTAGMGLKAEEADVCCVELSKEATWAFLHVLIQHCRLDPLQHPLGCLVEKCYGLPLLAIPYLPGNQVPLISPAFSMQELLGKEISDVVISLCGKHQKKFWHAVFCASSFHFFITVGTGTNMAIKNIPSSICVFLSITGKDFINL